MADFIYQPPFPLGKDETVYRKIKGSEKFGMVLETLPCRVF